LQIEELINLYGDEILRLCLGYLGHRQMAEDAFQETFVKAWKHLADFRGESSVRTWLSHIAVNICRDLLRSRWFGMWKRSQPVDMLLELSSGDIPQPASPVRDAVLALPGRYREVILLYYDQNMNAREIADCLKLSINTVTTRLRRAREILRKELKGEIEL